MHWKTLCCKVRIWHYILIIIKCKILKNIFIWWVPYVQWQCAIVAWQREWANGLHCVHFWAALVESPDRPVHMVIFSSKQTYHWSSTSSDSFNKSCQYFTFNGVMWLSLHRSKVSHLPWFLHDAIVPSLFWPYCWLVRWLITLSMGCITVSLCI